MRGIRRTGAGLVVLSFLLGGLVVGMTPATAATGDTVTTIIADRGPDSTCKSTNPAGDHAGVGTGIAFDGVNLILSCWDSNELVYVNATTGAFVKRVLITGGTNFGAMAYDGSGKVLWVCNNDSDIGTIDLTAGTYTKAFSTAGCVDGLAWDGKDSTIWESPDASHDVYHYQPAGTLIQHYTVSLDGFGNSGLAVGGDTLYLGNDGGGEIFSSDKTLAAPTVFIGTAKTGGRRVEDMECDNVTFAASGKAVMWSQDAYDNILNAYEIPNGSCTFGGGVTTTTTTAAPTTTAPTTTAAAALAVDATPAFTG
jgi:hypothetical protein